MHKEICPIRLAFCGCGNIARAHARELSTMPGAQIRAYWNRPEDAHLAEAMRREFGGEYVARDLSEIAEDDGIDAVYICTMHNDRLRIVQTMADAGKALFVEKPLAHTPDALRAMSRILEAHPVLWQSGYKTRFNSLVEQACRLMPCPEIMMAHVFDARWPDNHVNVPDIGGGNLRAQGVYAADALHILAGSPPVAVTAIGGNRRQSSGVEDTLCANFEFAGGVIGTLAVADAGVGAGTVSKFFVEAAGNNQGLALLERFARLEYLPSPEQPLQVITGQEDGFRRQSERFLQAVRHGEPSPCAFLDGAVPSIMIARALDAVASGRRETIDIDSWLQMPSP